jgi:hypothetical protein
MFKIINDTFDDLVNDQFNFVKHIFNLINSSLNKKRSIYDLQKIYLNEIYSQKHIDYLIESHKTRINNKIKRIKAAGRYDPVGLRFFNEHVVTQDTENLEDCTDMFGRVDLERFNMMTEISNECIHCYNIEMCALIHNGVRDIRDVRYKTSYFKYLAILFARRDIKTYIQE